MHYAQTLLQAGSFMKLRDYRAALKLYTDAQWHLLFKAMLPVSDRQVQDLQEKRFECFRGIRSPNTSEEA